MEKATYHDGKKRRHRVDVLVCNDKNEVLCFDHGPGKLPELPGGGIDEGEDAITAAHREVMEESGWVIINAKVFPNSKPFIFDGVDHCWFTEEGWRQELNICVGATAVEYKPTSDFGKHGDHQKFVFMPIERVLSMTEASLNNNISEHFKNIARSRIETIKTLKLLLEGTPPSWYGW